MENSWKVGGKACEEPGGAIQLCYGEGVQEHDLMFKIFVTFFR